LLNISCKLAANITGISKDLIGLYGLVLLGLFLKSIAEILLAKKVIKCVL
jgi:hypothetical protein